MKPSTPADLDKKRSFASDDPSSLKRQKLEHSTSAPDINIKASAIPHSTRDSIEQDDDIANELATSVMMETEVIEQ